MTGKKPRDIDVELVPNPAGNPPLLFTIDHDKLTFKNDHHPGFLVRFNIIDSQHTLYKFPDNPDDAMWVQTIDSTTPNNCPNTPMYWDGFKGTRVTNSNMTLDVDNPNTAEQLFAFTLRFTLQPHDTNPHCEPFDPIGSDKNGPASRSAAALLLTVVIVAVAAFAAYKLFLS